ncbi:MAG: carbon starvation protein A [Oligoflexia bacterium]|nr:carbon starvation protein A [Oligoflexia bacterium]
MNAAVLGIIGLVSFVCAYRFYGRYISRKLFDLNDLDQQGIQTPANELYDGVDYVPTNKEVLLGHHFSSIAGAAPIVGPAVAAIWGWLPALCWIVIGVIFMGACHDFGALVLSMKHKGQSMASVSEKLVGPRVRTLFLVVIFFLVWMVIAVFALVIANLFISFPSAVLPVNFEIFIAIMMGIFINKKKGENLLIPSLVAQGMLLVMIYLGTQYPITLSAWFGDNQLMVWITFLMIYSFIASVLPVSILLQPRDFINGHQLIFGLGLMILGLLVGQPKVVAPMINTQANGAPDWFPYLFITIACGAISGFHGLVSGGTSSKQVKKWKDALPVGYGAMLGEGTLALLATLAVCAGFKSSAAWHSHYSSWNAANGLSAKIGAFVQGSSSFIGSLGIPEEFAQTVVAVLIISFAATSLDTACRIQRYIIAEFGESLKIPHSNNRYLSSAIAIGSAFLLMLSSDGAKGGLKLWPLFGATNQMLAALTLIIIVVFLIKNKKPSLPYLIPCLFLMLITSLGLIMNIRVYISGNNTFLTVIGIILFIAQLWITTEAILAISKARKEA